MLGAFTFKSSDLAFSFSSDAERWSGKCKANFRNSRDYPPREDIEFLGRIENNFQIRVRDDRRFDETIAFAGAKAVLHDYVGHFPFGFDLVVICYHRFDQGEGISIGLFLTKAKALRVDQLLHRHLADGIEFLVTTDFDGFRDGGLNADVLPTIEEFKAGRPHVGAHDLEFVVRVPTQKGA